MQTKNLLLIFLLLFVASSCKKDYVAYSNNGITGKWQLIETREVFNGNEWRPAAVMSIIGLETNSSLYNPDSLYNGATKYEVINDSTVNFSINFQINTVLSSTFYLEENNSILIVMPPCIEGCAEKYKAVP